MDEIEIWLQRQSCLPQHVPPAGQRLADGRTEDDATSIQRPPPSLPPSTASRRVSSSSASSSISSAVATSPSNGEQADSGRDYMATDGECSKEFIPSSPLIGNIFGNVDFACLANLAISPCARDASDSREPVICISFRVWQIPVILR